jgi:hypothetical protein
MVDALREEVRLFTSRLERAQLHVDAPLSLVQLVEVVRRRLDPHSEHRPCVHTPTLGETTSVADPRQWAPMAMQTQWRAVRLGAAWHRSFWISEWPRLEAPPDWLTGVVLHPGGVRTLTVVYEPIAPSRSRRAIDRDATRLASDEDQRTRRGFRIRAQHRRAENEVLAREAELVAGYPELTYAGFLTVSAPDRETLEAQTRDWEQTCAQAGVELRALDGQHDLGLILGLPCPAPLHRRR